MHGETETLLRREGLIRAGLQTERDGGDSSHDTADSIIEQQYRTALFALKHTGSSYKPTTYMDNGLSFDAPSKCLGGGSWPLLLEVAMSGVGTVVFREGV